ncbi:MAG: putative selenium-dependent hydroxylase accessory protein YqeC [Anaerolineales bacterium]|nr:putative selenium-dependent hydroxylase accessory protein YqeC [Anaerolineales bacterium]
MQQKFSDLDEITSEGVTLVTGEIEEERTKPVNQDVLYWLREASGKKYIPLFIEADGSRQKSLKSPADHEPPIPEFVDTAVVVAGLNTLGRPLTDEHVHRAGLFSQIAGLDISQQVTANSVTRMLTHPQGGLKNIPPAARRIALLNQADTPELKSIGGGMARDLLDHFDSVIVGSLNHNSFQTFEHTAGIVLAAGASTRFGAPKQLLDWKGKSFVRHVAETALQAGLWPVVVVTGFHSEEVESALHGLPVNIIHNPDYLQGQSTSIRTGIDFLKPGRPHDTIGSAIFLLTDQPQIPVEVLRALVESHTQKMQAIAAPLVLGSRRANPVLFDRSTFPDLLQLEGDVGGRAIFSKYKVEYMPWHDELLLLDVDNPEDYQRLVENEKL